ncbi:hypothetical protein FE257_001290 [Aspergillus nanangensis]|uniref:Aminoglycoside phosphotransferase domain-containing protein n=1 Tax=Aspergillus nanangensis TaxID=2582783 RepID=A0AAD4GP06_ASPNN|nr:hypothetical protein FE257_001290 [Aspergillus nanangensis]
MYSVIYRTNPDLRPSALCSLLQRYGVGHIIECDSKCTPEVPSREDEVLLINGDHDISCAAIRQGTFRTARLPQTFAVWDSHLQEAVVAVRVSNRTFRESLAANPDLASTARALAQRKDLASTTYQDFCSNVASAVGGSFSDSGVHQYFAKVANGRGIQKLLDEIRMYQSLPTTLRDYYPRLLFSSEEDSGAVTMATEFRDCPNLRDLLLNNHISVAGAADILAQVLDYEYNHAFQQHKQPTPANYIRDYHFHRAWRRLTLSAEIDPIFGPLIAAPWLEVNGRRIASVPSMLLRLEQDAAVVNQRLDPGGVSPFVHADFHPGNILYDTTSDRFWLVDPRGYPVCDIYYDLGKLAQSSRSCYDLLHEGRHVVSYAVEGDTAVIDYEFVAPELRAEYRELHERLQPIVRRVLKVEEEHEREKDVDLRVRFNEAMHLCSLMPFHIHKNAAPSLAVPIFAAGATRLAEVMDILGIHMEECAKGHARGLERLEEMGSAEWRFEG